MAAAALSRSRMPSHRADGLQPTRLARDLYQIAGLVELCFGAKLDAGGRSAVEEMKVVSRLGPLLWLLSFLTPLEYGTGYVWRVDGRVVGNASLFKGGTHPHLGHGWLIANVAVHPDYRRQGIARALMEATLELARRQGGRWAALQVEADNAAALALYRSLGFESYEMLEVWQADHVRRDLLPPPGERALSVHQRRIGEVEAEANLIYSHARRGAMAWSRPIERADITGGLFGEASKEHWVLPAVDRPAKLDGVLWVEMVGWRQSRMTLFLDPDMSDPQARQALLQQVLQRPSAQDRSWRVECTAGDPPVEALLMAAEFRRVRSLVQMRRQLG